MIFVSSGKGGWILGSLAICVGVLACLDRFFFPNHTDLTFLVIALAIAGVFCLALGLQARLQRPATVLERSTGRQRLVRVVHSLYWIRAEYWGLLFLALAAWLFTYHPRT